MKVLFYVRHGESELNAKGLFSDDGGSPLTKKGEQQALQTANLVKAKLPKIDLIICSPYKRAVDTAKIIAKELGYSEDKIQTSELFIERTYGSLEGTSGKDFYATRVYRDIDDVEGAETVEQLQKRAQKALEYVEQQAEDNILVVAHGAFGRAFKRAVHKLPHTHEYEYSDPIGNAEVLELI